MNKKSTNTISFETSTLEVFSALGDGDLSSGVKTGGDVLRRLNVFSADAAERIMAGTQPQAPQSNVEVDEFITELFRMQGGIARGELLAAGFDQANIDELFSPQNAAALAVNNGGSIAAAGFSYSYDLIKSLTYDRGHFQLFAKFVMWAGQPA